MSVLYRLIRTQLDVVMGLSAWRHSGKKSKWLYLLLPLFALPFFISIFAGLRWLLVSLAGTGLESSVLALVFAGVQLMVLVASLPYIISVFFLNDDLDILLPLPIPPWQLVAAKLATVWLGELFISLVFLGPAALAWLAAGPVTGPASLLYGVAALVLVALLLPVIPLSLGAVIALLFMRVVSPSKERFKEYMQVTGGMLGVLLGVSINLVTQRFANSNPEQLMAKLTEPGGLVARLTSYFPPSRWAVWTAAPDNALQALVGMLLLVGVSATALAAVAMLAEKWYLTGLLGRSVAAGRPADRQVGVGGTARRAALEGDRQAKRSADGARNWQAVVAPLPLPISLFIKEWRLFWRTPGFSIHGVLVSLLMPVMFIIVAVVGPGQKSLGEVGTQLRIWAETLPLLPLLAAALSATAWLNPPLVVGFSREGRQAWNGVILPVPASHQAMAKIALAVAVSLIPLAAYTLLIGYFLHLPVPLTLSAALWALLVALAGQALGLAIDYLLPKLDWNNPMQVAQNSLGGALASFAVLLPPFILGFTSFWLWRHGWPPDRIVPVLVAGTLTADIFALLLVARAARYRLEKSGI